MYLVNPPSTMVTLSRGLRCMPGRNDTVMSVIILGRGGLRRRRVSVTGQPPGMYLDSIRMYRSAVFNIYMRGWAQTTCRISCVSMRILRCMWSCANVRGLVDYGVGDGGGDLRDAVRVVPAAELLCLHRQREVAVPIEVDAAVSLEVVSLVDVDHHLQWKRGRNGAHPAHREGTMWHDYSAKEGERERTK